MNQADSASLAQPLSPYLSPHSVFQNFPQSQPESHIFLMYEEIFEHPAITVQLLADLLERPCSDEVCAKVVLNLQSQPGPSHPHRKGKHTSCPLKSCMQKIMTTYVCVPLLFLICRWCWAVEGLLLSGHERSLRRGTVLCLFRYLRTYSACFLTLYHGVCRFIFFLLY